MVLKPKPKYPRDFLKHSRMLSNNNKMTREDGISSRPAEGNKRILHHFEIQPDGLKSYAVCLAATFCNVVVMGYCYSYGVIFPPLLTHFQEDKATTGNCRYVTQLLRGFDHI